MAISVDNLRADKSRILAIAEKHGASNVRVFGSVARGAAGANSDVDFLVDLGAERSLLDKIGLKQDLEDLLGRSVDIAEVATLHDRVRDRVLKDAIAL